LISDKLYSFIVPLYQGRNVLTIFFEDEGPWENYLLWVEELNKVRNVGSGKEVKTALHRFHISGGLNPWSKIYFWSGSVPQVLDTCLAQDPEFKPQYCQNYIHIHW
jgi:hypothetical protein